MKKSILLSVLCCLLMSAHAQTGTDRWYNYADVLDRNCKYNKTYGYAVDSLMSLYPFLWNDAKALNNRVISAICDTDSMMSEAIIIDPKYWRYNTSDLYSLGELVITPTDAFDLDSVAISGIYGTNPARITAGVRDTLRLSFLYGGDVSTTTTGGKTVGILAYDTVNNMARAVVHSYNVMTIILNPADTLPNGMYYKTIPLNAATSTEFGASNIHCAANEVVAVSLSFKSGDPTFAPYDTAFMGSYYKYNIFRPLVNYESTGGTHMEWPSYYPMNVYNMGLFKFCDDDLHGWPTRYVPETVLAWGGLPCPLQVPNIGLHVACSACTNVIMGPIKLSANSISNKNKVDVTPNPANSTLTFDLGDNPVKEWKISLTNMLGQIAFAEDLKNSVKSETTISTANLPAGSYVYSIETNGAHFTGQVTVVH